MSGNNEIKSIEITGERNGGIPTISLESLLLMMKLSEGDFIINVSLGEEGDKNGG